MTTRRDALRLGLAVTGLPAVFSTAASTDKAVDPVSVLGATKRQSDTLIFGTLANAATFLILTRVHGVDLPLAVFTLAA